MESEKPAVRSGARPDTLSATEKEAPRKKKRAKRAKLCAHVKDDGRLCGAPAMRNHSYCWHHRELRQRRKRMARAQFISRLREVIRQEREAAFNAAVNLPLVKELLVKSFDGKFLPRQLESTSSASSSCGTQGEG